MIARPKISRNEWKMAEIGAFEVGNLALLCCPADDVAEPRRPPGPVAVPVEVLRLLEDDDVVAGPGDVGRDVVQIQDAAEARGVARRVPAWAAQE